MELNVARQIIDSLAKGINPITGAAFPEDSPYNAPPIIRALWAVSKALDERWPQQAPTSPPTSPRKWRGEAPPANAGKAWTDEWDDELRRRFHEGEDLAAIADAMGRTRFGVEQRLIKLGLIEVQGRFKDTTQQEQ
jgi:hypothetical protein